MLPRYAELHCRSNFSFLSAASHPEELVAVLVGISPLWVRREKLVAVLLIPGAALLMGLLPQVGWWLIGAKGVYGGAWTALILVLLGGGTILARSTRKAAARGHRPESSARAARQD